MVLFALTSYIKFVGMRSIATPLATMKFIALRTSKLLFPSWKVKASSQRLTLMGERSQLGRTDTALNLMNLRACFVGVMQEGNCKDYITRDTMAKKNTRVRSPSVFNVVSKINANDGRLVTPILADHTNLYNRFVGLHV